MRCHVQIAAPTPLEIVRNLMSRGTLREIGFVVRRSKPAWSRECESLTGKEQRSILTPSLAWPSREAAIEA